MLSRVLGGKYDERRLRLLLAVLFLALAVPTGAVLWQAYGQLKWEAFHQLRGQAEELSERIDRGISEAIATAEAQNFAAYSFLNVSGDPAAGFLQRSPLSAYPVAQDLPGVIGYFQVDAEGRFSTPLLPQIGTEATDYGIGSAELHERQALSDRIRRVLAENRLVEDREDVDRVTMQQSFDQLAQGTAARNEEESPIGQKPQESAASTSRERQYSKIRDLRLDDALQKKSESAEADEKLVPEGARRPAAEPIADAEQRSRRIEQEALLAPAAPEAHLSDAVAEPEEMRITTFQSEVDPFEFTMLDSGEFVLFRKVWREGERLVQGILIDREAFLEKAVVSAYKEATLSAVTDLVVGFGEDVIQVEHSNAGRRNAGRRSEMEGDLLYRRRLSSPVDAIELIYSVGRLPAGPGAQVLAWTTLLLAAVFGGGFLALYRLGLGQIRLARQQQDFVSSVSHELKTPLTSIRMYSEMLKEGWADETRRRQYYEFIHDESERLSRLISNVLQLASITRNEPIFELRPITAGELLDRIRSKISSQVERAGFELAVSADAGSAGAVVEVDEDCLTQIVINLVDNALKFSKKAGEKRIEIGARASGDGELRISVRDYGPGIPREQMKKIFRLFYRPQGEMTRETVGTGIGLAIVHQLTVAMGGTVDVLNREPGAEFGVSFPIRLRQPDRDPG